MSEVTLAELKESFDVNISWPKTTAYMKTFELTNGAGVRFKGRLYWDSNDGFSIYWDGKGAPEMAHRSEFAYVLDSYSSDPSFIPTYGDLSDAGMDGA